jgi:hypothetical protein
LDFLSIASSICDLFHEKTIGSTAKELSQPMLLIAFLGMRVMFLPIMKTIRIVAIALAAS